MLNHILKFSAMLLLSSVAFSSALAQGEVLNSGSSQFWKTAGNNGISAANFLGPINNSSLRIRTNNIQRMIVDSIGNVGIGTGVPSTSLHVAGGFRLVNGSQANNFILFSDANGLSVWKPADSVLSNATTKAWNITGNTGTNATTNFIGTLDAVDFVIKTNGSASTQERMRVIGSGATPGQVVVNNRANLAGDVFSVYANNTTNGTTNSINNSVGIFSVSGYADGTGVGVYGESFTTGSNNFPIGVWGTVIAANTPASTQSDAVYGSNSSAPLGTGGTAGISSGVTGVVNASPGTATTIGIFGVNTATTGTAYGAYGYSASSAGLGVFGLNASTAATPAHGIQGQTAATSVAAGVRGFNTAATLGAGSSAYGVRGSANGIPSGSGFAAGVRGDCAATSGSTYGTFGQAASASGFGVYGLNTNASGTGLFAIGNNTTGSFLTGGTGAAITGTTTGTFSLATSAAAGVGGVFVGNNLTGSIITPAVGCGVSGVGNQFGVVGYATSNNQTTASSNLPASGANASAGGYFEIQNAGGTSQTWSYVAVRENTGGAGTLRKIIGPGTVNTIVKDLSGNLVALSCPEAPENLFEDWGKGVLKKGKAHINLDPVFTKNIIVDQNHPLRVVVQVEGECHGVYVTNKTQNSFDVVELDCGTSNVPFTYHVVANRADELLPDGTWSRYSTERFAAAPGPVKSTKLTSATSLTPQELNPIEDKIVQVPEQIKNGSIIRQKEKQ